ncbi:FKBP-type peptidyl-prolyl cis-trans isomerase [Aurantiacibacter gangjinensis]|uniref:Peptidyl-prolyl cis-trans isomerase n=1 Tax=Aurantiacibacter gangjinensis TaxID=502682 RepID=A0A0G9MT42_9SPHN|nr:FKBP-type peptidyl-prolyl cis-trans isomerase [Aurantiacibacter gangjinensis]APE29222.1 FKBP-type peptidyl-prolyl cis-trans isomerase FkpA precursor [Aurantiacibacter gangjinensis]KLE33694.1 peptidylprolyl isomerase [Aurantiacibacter gangjinensis]
MKKPVLPLIALGLAAASVVTATAQDMAAPAPGEVGSLEWHNAQQLALHERTAADGWSTLDGGIKFRRFGGDGSGPAPTVEDEITIHYHGTFPDGTVFDSSLERGEPATFPLSRLIRGWQTAIPYMGVGDSATVVIPAEQAYGLEGRGPIPGGATLIFNIDLLGIPSQPSVPPAISQ